MQSKFPPKLIKGWFHNNFKRNKPGVSVTYSYRTIKTGIPNTGTNRSPIMAQVRASH